MNKLILTLLLTLSFTALYAQTNQSVSVKEYNGKNKKSPLGQVSVSVTNAGAAMTDANGSATLRFRTLKAGDKVDVRRIEKAGYEVFNKDALDQWTISATNTFNIVLCRSDRFKAMRDDYMRLSSASYERQFKKDQAKLEAERQAGKLKEEEFQQQMQDLQDEYDEQLENLENYVEQFSRIDLSEISSQEQKIIALVQEGKMDEAVALYEKHDFLGRYEKETKEIEKIDAATKRLQEVEERKRKERAEVQAAISRQVATYRLAGGRENFAKIKALLKGLADADLTNMDAVCQYAEYALKQNLFDECERYSQICLDNKDASTTIRHICLEMQSICYQNERKYEQAETSMLGIVSLFKQGYEQSPDAYTLAYARSLLNLTNFYSASSQYDNMDAYITIAINLYEKLINDPEQDEPLWSELAELYSNKSILMLIAEDAEGAEQLANKAYQLVQKNYDIKDDDQCLLLEQVLNGVGQVYYLQEKWTEQGPFVTQSVELQETLYNRNPERYTASLMGAYNNMSEYCMHIGQLDKAESYFLKADQLLSQLYAQNGDMHAIDRFCLYEAAAHIYEAKGDADKARHYATEALVSFGKMQPEDQEGYAEPKEGLDEMLKAQ